MAAIRIENETSDYRQIKRGVRQGRVLSPDLCKLYSEMILRNIDKLNGVKVGGRDINNLRYAVLIADSEQKLQSLLTTASVKCEERGLQLNAKKTECMVVLKKLNAPTCNISCNGVEIKQVKMLKYLGYNITQDARSDCEIMKRIAMAKDAFCKMKSIFTNRMLDPKAGYQKFLIKTIRNRQMKFLGHICRKDGIEKQVLCGKIEGR